MQQPHWCPNPTQQLLLQACLLSEEKAIAAFRTWLQAAKATRHDSASQRLLPLLWWRCNEWQLGSLQRQYADESAAWKSAMLQTWALNQRRLSHANQLAEQLSRAGIPLLVVKGLPLALAAYGHLGLRPMGDLDLVVPDIQAGKSLEVLSAAGWTPLPTPLKGSDDPEVQQRYPWSLENRALADFSNLYFRVRNGHGFRHADGTEADLHWYIFHEQCDPGIDETSWAHSLALEQWNRSSAPEISPHLFMLDPVDHLLLILAHASRWDAIAPIRWVADAVLLVKAVDQFNWKRFVDLAIERSLVAPVRDLLAYLQSQMDLDVPAETMAALAIATDPSTSQRLSMRSLPDVWGGGEELIYLLRRWRRLREDHQLRRQVPGLMRFCCHILGIPSRRYLLQYGFLELQRRWSH
jgi:hypothetical protein